MTDAGRRAAALAAVFAAGRAGAILRRLPEREAGETIELAAALAGAARRDRLRALAGALASDPREIAARADAAARRERPRLAALLLAVAAGDAAGPTSPVLLRLCREAIGR